MKINAFKSYKDITFYILVIIGFYTIVASLLTNRSLSWHTYVGLGAISFCVFLFFAYYKLFKYFFVLTLFVGLFNVIHFTYNITTISFYVGIFKAINIETVEVQLLSLMLLLLHGIFYRKLILEKLRKLMFKSEEEKIDERENQISMYKIKFSGMSENELKRMINNKDTYSEEAIVAAERLLKE